MTRRSRKEKKQREKLNIQILLLSVLVVVGTFTAQGLGGSMLSALAMDQQAMCGMTEHVHTDSCYNEWDILQCGETEHTHTNNCYMVLLENNNINTLLEEVDAAEDHSLTNLVTSVSSSGSPQTSGSSGSTVSRNASSLVLNENLITAAETGNGGISTFKVGDSPNTGSRMANFYVYLDGKWTCIGSLSWTWYNRNISVETIVNLVNSSMGTSYTKRDFDLAWAKSADARTGKKADITNSTNVTLNNNSSDTAASYVRIVPGNGDWNNINFAFNTVTYNYLNGITTTEYVRTNTTITLPASTGGWMDNINGGTIYAGGDRVPIDQKTIFTEQDATGNITITYNVNFPNLSNVSVETADRPTIMGGSSYSQTVEEGQIAPVYNVSRTTTEGLINSGSHSPGQTRAFRFMGWRVGNTNTIIPAGSSLTWETLSSYGRRVTLNGVWEYDAKHSVSFFVSYRSADISITDPNQFTPQIYVAFLEGDDIDTMSAGQLDSKYQIKVGVEQNTPGYVEALVRADENIRALYGEQDGVWMETFPSDEYVFNELKKYAEDLSVDGIQVKAEDLNDNGYTIRWYVFKCQDDAWHVDGILVRKAGNLEVTKSFAGNKDAIQAIKNGNFYIQATSEYDRSERLTLSNYDSYNPQTDTYTWIIEDISYGEKWNLEEKNYGTAYAEYRIVDASGEQATSGKYTGTPVQVTGMTYAVDIGAEVMSVDFTNIYKGYDSLIIKKEDSQTRLPLAGAGFTLIQNGQPLMFQHDAEKNVYTRSDLGTVSELSGGSSGFVEISVTGLDFSAGDITVHESTVPPGYSFRGDIVLTKANNQIQVASGNDAVFDNGVLVIGNSSDIVNVTVEKTWSNPDDAEDVKIQLLANDRLVSTLVAGINAEVTLNSANSYKYTWNNLPRYANGQKVNWSVREVQIGTEQCKPDFTFSNWIVTYSDVQETGTDGNYEAKLVVNNTRKDAVTLLVFKTNQNNQRLAGATFKLELLYDDGTVNSAFTPQVLTTDSTGLLSFNNLPYGKYRLTETVIPPGYNGMTDPAILLLSDDHTVSIVSGTNVTIVSASNLSVRVTNHSSEPLPETGGSTPGGIQMAGGVLMLMACLMALNIFVMHRRKKRS
ncbi:MAG: hypothetical protein IKM19_09730 [Firmicutes bacterium]|nr:hypothetical protein [Bacillota bacterium]